MARGRASVLNESKRRSKRRPVGGTQGMTKIFRWIALLFVAAIAVACSTATEAPSSAAEETRVLVFSHTTGYRHASIEAGVAMFREIGAREGWGIDHSEDPAVFTTEQLAQYDAIVFLSSTSGRDPAREWIVGPRRDALQAFVRSGKGIVGIHAAADSHYNWPWYRQMIGGAFRTHPPGEPEGNVTIVDGDHPSTRGLTRDVRRPDEWYYYVDFDPNVRLLAVYDPRSIGQPETAPNPISWAHEFEGGRVFYTGMGHVEAA